MLLLAVMALNAAASSACPPTPPRGMIVEQTPFGGVIASDQAAIQAGVAAGDQAAAAAQRHLGLASPTFVIAEGVNESSPHGCALLFPWRFSQFKAGEAPRTDFAVNKALIPLSKLLSMPHPELAPQETTVPSLGEVVTRPPASADTMPFYATVRALFDFLVQRTGDEQVVRRLAEQVEERKPLDEWLVTHASKAGLPQDLTALDAELEAFVFTDAKYALSTETNSSANS